MGLSVNPIMESYWNVNVLKYFSISGHKIVGNFWEEARTREGSLGITEVFGNHLHKLVILCNVKAAL
jgi:hypothetical protein